MTPHEASIKATSEWFAYQNQLELEMALTIVDRMKPKVVMEIGVAHGASLAAWAAVAEPELVISLDPEDIPRTDAQKASYERLREEYKFQRIPFYDRNPKAQDLLEVILAGRKVDFLFIDGAHDFHDVVFDFYTYKRFMAPNGIVGFHDIAYNEVLADAGSTISWFWERMQTRYNHDIFYNHSTMGIGLIYLDMPILASVHET